MKVDSEIKMLGLEILNEHLGVVETERFIALIQRERFDYTKWRENLFSGLSGFLSGGGKNQEAGHCNAFIATGDATVEGSIVVAQATMFGPYIAERCNIILDVQPSEGYRFIMTCPPGSIWSQEDYYQNEKGIILIDGLHYLISKFSFDSVLSILFDINEQVY